MKIAITGGAGFLGSNLSEALSQEGHELIIFDDLSWGRKEDISKKAKFVEADIRKDISADLEGAEALFHLAAEPSVRACQEKPAEAYAINVGGTASVLESCRKADVMRVVFASSSAVYGLPKHIPTNEDEQCSPLSNYGSGKLVAESYLSSYASAYGIKCTTLRLANVFGPLSRRGVIYDIFIKLRKDPRSLEILGDGKQDKSYLYVSDCVSGMLIGWKKQSAQYDVLNIGSAEKMTVSEIARRICSMMGISPEIKYGTSPTGWAGDVPLMLLDTSKIKSMGWKAEVSFDEGLKKYLEWLSHS